MDSHYIAILAVLAVIIVAQFYFFFSVLRSITSFRKFFPKREYSLENTDTDDDPLESQKEGLNPRHPYYKLIESIREYLEKSKGISDFSVIRSITERRLQTLQEKITSRIAVPLYIGLMGTFIGVMIGLLFLISAGRPEYYKASQDETLTAITHACNISVEELTRLNPNMDVDNGKLQRDETLTIKAGLSDERRVRTFLGGVLIAMIGSFLGLLLTVINNAGFFRNAKIAVSDNKSSFYDFLQISLLPEMGTGFFAALSALKDNINHFNHKFSESLDVFDEKFASNIKELKDSLSGFGNNIEAINENTVEQKRFLEELRKQEFQKIVEATLAVFRIMESSAPRFVEFTDRLQELNKTVDQSREFAVIISSVLDRVKTFEENINELGERIDAADYMGSDLLNKINRELNELDDKFALLKQHSQQTTDDIQDYFKDELDRIKLLTESMKQTIQGAFDFTIENESPLEYIRELKDIREKVDDIQQNSKKNGELTNISETLKKLVEVTESAKKEETGDPGRRDRSDRRERTSRPSDKIEKTETSEKKSDKPNKEIDKSGKDKPPKKGGFFSGIRKYFKRNKG